MMDTFDWIDDQIARLYRQPGKNTPMRRVYMRRLERLRARIRHVNIDSESEGQPQQFISVKFVIHP